MVRKFGKIVVKPSKANPKWIEASYLTPVSAFSEWPDLPNRQTATFPWKQATLRRTRSDFLLYSDKKNSSVLPKRCLTEEQTRQILAWAAGKA